MHQHLEQWWLLGKSKNQCTGESPVPLHASDCNGLQGLHYSFCSLTGLFAEVGGLLSPPLGCALSGLHRLAEPPRMPPAAASCGSATLLPLHRVRNTNTLVRMGEPQHLLLESLRYRSQPTRPCLEQAVTTMRPDTELWSSGPQPLLLL